MSRVAHILAAVLVGLALAGLPVAAGNPTAEIGARFDVAAQQVFGQLRTEIGSILATAFTNGSTTGLNVGTSIARLADDETFSLDFRLNGQASFTLREDPAFGVFPAEATFSFGLSTDAKLKPIGGRLELAFLAGMNTNGQPVLIPTVSVDLDVGKLSGLIASVLNPQK